MWPQSWIRFCTKPRRWTSCAAAQARWKPWWRTTRQSFRPCARRTEQTQKGARFPKGESARLFLFCASHAGTGAALALRFAPAPRAMPCPPAQKLRRGPAMGKATRAAPGRPRRPFPGLQMLHGHKARGAQRKAGRAAQAHHQNGVPLAPAQQHQGRAEQRRRSPLHVARRRGCATTAGRRQLSTLSSAGALW